jgi:hypothetical protein
MVRVFWYNQSFIKNLQIENDDGREGAVSKEQFNRKGHKE